IESLGYNVKSQELNPQQASERIPEGQFDLVVFTSPIPGNFDIPIINATGLLTGIGEEQVYSEIKHALEE
ncbi:PTS fructose transporter subunit IIB, partial [Lactobacillus sp. XV13L]|nr:PTS fructose transporter subunit IIB [Lactobacillus sp. XV13L]